MVSQPHFCPYDYKRSQSHSRYIKDTGPIAQIYQGQILHPSELTLYYEMTVDKGKVVYVASFVFKKVFNMISYNLAAKHRRCRLEKQTTRWGINLDHQIQRVVVNLSLFNQIVSYEQHSSNINTIHQHPHLQFRMQNELGMIKSDTKVETSCYTGVQRCL